MGQRHKTLRSRAMAKWIENASRCGPAHGLSAPQAAPSTRIPSHTRAEAQEYGGVGFSMMVLARHP